MELHIARVVMNKEKLTENVKTDDRLGMRGPGRQAERESVVAAGLTEANYIAGHISKGVDSRMGALVYSFRTFYSFELPSARLTCLLK